MPLVLIIPWFLRCEFSRKLTSGLRHCYRQSIVSNEPSDCFCLYRLKEDRQTFTKISSKFDVAKKAEKTKTIERRIRKKKKKLLFPCLSNLIKEDLSKKEKRNINGLHRKNVKNENKWMGIRPRYFTSSFQGLWNESRLWIPQIFSYLIPVGFSVSKNCWRHILYCQVLLKVPNLWMWGG